MKVTKKLKVVVDDSIKAQPEIEAIIHQANSVFVKDVLEKIEDEEPYEREIHWGFDPGVDPDRVWVSYQEHDTYGFRRLAAAAYLPSFSEPWQQRVFLLDLMQSATQVKSRHVRERVHNLMNQLEHEEGGDAKSDGN